MLLPEMKLPLPQPLTVNIHLAMSTFSTPWSALTLHVKRDSKKQNKKKNMSDVDLKKLVQKVQ